MTLTWAKEKILMMPMAALQPRSRYGPLFPFPALLLDLSLTSAHARIVTEDIFADGWSGQVDLARFSSATGVVDHLMEETSSFRPASLLIAFPGPVLGFRARFTNSDWIVDCVEISKRFDFENGILLNDQEAAAFSVPDLGTNEYINVGSRALPFGAGPEALVSIRHGLGVASLRRLDARYVSLASEAGHIGLSPGTEEEAELLSAVIRDIGRPNAESLLFRPGLALIHAARLKLAGRPAPALSTEEVARAALPAPDGEEAQSVTQFVSLVSSYAGDVALALFATGGMTLSGGVLRTLAPFFQKPSVRAAFEAKVPMTEVMRKISFRLALIEDMTLRGLTVLAQSPEHFAINVEQRCWRDIG